jgi:hypothetical protein
MTLRTLVSRLAKAEGKKHQASVGDCRELVKLLFDIAFSEEEFKYLYDSEMIKRLLKSKKSKKK